MFCNSILLNGHHGKSGELNTSKIAKLNFENKQCPLQKRLSFSTIKKQENELDTWFSGLVIMARLWWLKWWWWWGFDTTDNDDLHRPLLRFIGDIFCCYVFGKLFSLKKFHYIKLGWRSVVLIWKRETKRIGNFVFQYTKYENLHFYWKKYLAIRRHSFPDNIKKGKENFWKLSIWRSNGK